MGERYCQLSMSERVTIMLMRQGGMRVRAIVRRLGRSPSTVYRRQFCKPFYASPMLRDEAVFSCDADRAVGIVRRGTDAGRLAGSSSATGERSEMNARRSR